MKRLKKNQIRTVISLLLIFMVMIHSTPIRPDIKAGQVSTEDFIEYQNRELDKMKATQYHDTEEIIDAEEFIPTISSNDVPTVAMASESYIDEQAQIQRQIMEDEQNRLEQIAREEAERKAQIESITADPYDVSKVSNLTEEQYYILTKDTWWEGKEQTLIDLEKNYGINAFFAMSVSTLESGSGTSNRARVKQNYYGAEVSRTFGGLYDNTMYFGDFLNRLYVQEGLVSVYQIGPKYCPPNRNWEEFMASNMQELYNKVMITLR